MKKLSGYLLVKQLACQVVWLICSTPLLLSYQLVIFLIKIACPYKLFIITQIGFHLEIISFHLETDHTFFIIPPLDHSTTRPYPKIVRVC